MVKTRFGSTDDSGALNEWAMQSLAERYQPQEAQQVVQEPAPVGETLGAQYNPSEFSQMATDWYTSKGHPDSSDEAALIVQKAVEHGLDPYMALALAAQEGGWARYYPEESPYNYMGWGETDSGSMGMGAQDLTGWLDTYIPDIVEQYGSRDKLTDWGGSLSGLGQGSPYSARYNYNDSWVQALSSLIREADSFSKNNYPNLPRPTIDPWYPGLN
jgi:hypothetical protein